MYRAKEAGRNRVQPRDADTTGLPPVNAGDSDAFSLPESHAAVE
jgi:hypothetical protein